MMERRNFLKRLIAAATSALVPALPVLPKAKFPNIVRKKPTEFDDLVTITLKELGTLKWSAIVDGGSLALGRTCPNSSAPP